MRLNLLEEKNAANEKKIAEQEKVIKMKADIKAKVEPNHFSETFKDERVLHLTGTNKRSLLTRKETSNGDSRQSAVFPSSCDDLLVIGHNLDGLYLVKNADTNKIETVFCDFQISGKFLYLFLRLQLLT